MACTIANKVHSNNLTFASSKDLREVKKDVSEMKNDIAGIRQTLHSIQTIMRENNRNKERVTDAKEIKIYSEHATVEGQSKTGKKMLEWRKKLQSLLDSYIDGLTVHGATRAFTGSMTQRIMWTIIMLGVLILLFCNGYVLLNKYFSHSVISSAQEVHVDGLKLPSVTVCDFDRFKCKLGEYHGARRSNSWENHNCEGDGFLGSAECYTNSTRKNCTTREHPGTPDCVTINPNQTIVQNTDGRNKLFQFMVRPASGKVRLFFHQHNELPTAYHDTLTYVVESGVYNVVLKQKNYSRLPKPYPSQCVPELVQNESPFLYTKKLCKQHCHAKSLLEKCGALNNYWLQASPSLNKSENWENSQYHTKDQIRECFRDFLQRPKQPCNCKVPCEEIRYNAKIEKFKEIRKVGAVLLFVYFEISEVITQVTEVPAYEVTSFLADIGGIAGLLLGMSILSVLEVILCLLLFMMKWIIS